MTAEVENIDLSLQLPCPLQEAGYDYGMQSCVKWETEILELKLILQLQFHKRCNGAKLLNAPLSCPSTSLHRSKPPTCVCPGTDQALSCISSFTNTVESCLLASPLLLICVYNNLIQTTNCQKNIFPFFAGLVFCLNVCQQLDLVLRMVPELR